MGGGTRRIVYATPRSGSLTRIFGSIFGSAGITVMPQTTDGLAGGFRFADGRQFQSTAGGLGAGRQKIQLGELPAVERQRGALAGIDVGSDRSRRGFHFC